MDGSGSGRFFGRGAPDDTLAEGAAEGHGQPRHRARPIRRRSPAPDWLGPIRTSPVPSQEEDASGDGSSRKDPQDESRESVRRLSLRAYAGPDRGQTCATSETLWWRASVLRRSRGCVGAPDGPGSRSDGDSWPASSRMCAPLRLQRKRLAERQHQRSRKAPWRFGSASSDRVRPPGPTRRRIAEGTSTRSPAKARGAGAR